MCIPSTIREVSTLFGDHMGLILSKMLKPVRRVSADANLKIIRDKIQGQKLEVSSGYLMAKFTKYKVYCKPVNKCSKRKITKPKILHKNWLPYWVSQLVSPRVAMSLFMSVVMFVPSQ